MGLGPVDRALHAAEEDLGGPLPESPLDPDAFWPYADTIGGSRWPGERGGPRGWRPHL